MAAADTYRTVRIRMWRSGSFARLSRLAPSGQALWLYLLTGAETTKIPGVIVSGRLTMAEVLGWSPEDIDRCFAELESEGMVVADWSARLIWLPNAVEINRPPNPNVLQSWGEHFPMLPDCDLKSHIYNALKSLAKGLGEPFMKGFMKGFMKPLHEQLPIPYANTGTGCRMQEQEEEERASEAPLASPDWPVFRCRASSKSESERRWTLGDDLVDSLQSAHPETDVVASLRDLHSRLNTGAQTLRTQRGMPAFASKWVANDATWGNHKRRNGSASPAASGYGEKAKSLAARWDLDLAVVEGYIRETGQTPASAGELRQWAAAQGV